ncbi:hypothetical protein CPT75_03415 [Butyrivibrio fibrisolvens]|uniref:N-acetyltransferase domain-containing protein n=2 Tax=Butyrivibrio fibrisolvens TaxID=831 RepID=A0A317FX21_BUTFI|nr:hypothetical protein CPT75_03415 [Butyrivibrio fibrisolvens]
MGYMKLRELQIKDAYRMYEWMHNADVIKDLHTDFYRLTLNDCFTFIANATQKSSALHLAIANDNDEYMGTVSLKNIRDSSAEFAIAVHPEAMGRGYSIFAMEKILEIGIKNYNLRNIYWCVSPANKRAIRFYDKNNFKRIDYQNLSLPNNVCYSDEEKRHYIWYSYENNKLL